MRQTKNIFLVGLFLLTINTVAQKSIKLRPSKFIATQIPEPSDICYNAKTDSFFVVSDDGILFETDFESKILRKMKESNCDFEAVYTDSNFVYAVDETHRTIHIFDSVTLKCSKIINIPYQGARNAGYEAFTFNKTTNTFVLIIEKNPIKLIELDSNFSIKNQIDLSKIARDISSASYNNGFLWLLSDEDRMVLKLDPTSYEVLAKWELPVINPEGLTFDKDSNLVITCDDMQRIYYFNNPEKQ